MCGNFRYHELGAGDGAAFEGEEDEGALVRHAPPHFEEAREGARERDGILV